MHPKQERQTPSVLFLIAVNALVLFGVTTIGIRDPRAFMATILILFLPLFLAALAGQGLVCFILRNRRVGEGMRAFLFLVPVVLAVTAAPFLLPLQQRQSAAPLPSPSSAYILEVPIQKATWTIRILSKDGETLHEEIASDFYGRFNSFWDWDEADRVWLYNSDTGEILFWELVDGDWQREYWGTVDGQVIERDILPPPGLFPLHGMTPLADY